jgi:ribose transport system substrate-binding protein
MAHQTHDNRIRRTRVLLAGLTLLLFVLASCEEAATGPPPEPASIAVIAKGAAHPFWQQVRVGAEAAGTELGVEVSYAGPESEDRAAQQATMLQNALDNNPDAVALASIDTNSLLDQIEEAQTRDIPIVGFDSGVPGAPSGSILATAATDNVGAGAVAAQKIFAEVSDAIGAASSEAPVTIVVLNVNPTIQSVAQRAEGFRDEMIARIVADTDLTESDIAVTGSEELIDAGTPTSGSTVFIEMLEPASMSTDDVNQLGADVVGRVTDDSIVGIFATNESTANGVLSATNEGEDLPGYTGLVVVGFDAGSRQKAAVRAEYFLGAIAQDSYTMGYDAVVLANRAHRGEAVSDIGTDGVYYDSSNMDDDGVANVLYD